jgi:hypothetical protein
MPTHRIGKGMTAHRVPTAFTHWNQCVTKFAATRVLAACADVLRAARCAAGVATVASPLRG